MAVSGMIANASAPCFVESDAKISISGDTFVLFCFLFICYNFNYIRYFSIISTKKLNFIPEHLLLKLTDNPLSLLVG